MDTEQTKWREYLLEGVRHLLTQAAMQQCIEEEHLRNTPARVVKAFEEYFWGVHRDPRKELRTAFTENGYDQMVVVAHVEFQSFCAHHLCPFIGRYSFAYLPNKRIVGLSKIPRMVEVFCARPQVQEQLSHQIVQLFQEVVEPLGCGICMDAVHTCACSRGVKKWFTTRTVALTGVFKTDAGVKAEFLSDVGPTPDFRL